MLGRTRIMTPSKVQARVLWGPPHQSAV